MKVDLKKLLALIEKKNSWGKEQLKREILNFLAEEE